MLKTNRFITDRRIHWKIWRQGRSSYQSKTWLHVRFNARWGRGNQFVPWARNALVVTVDISTTPGGTPFLLIPPLIVSFALFGLVHSPWAWQHIENRITAGLLSFAPVGGAMECWDIPGRTKAQHRRRAQGIRLPQKLDGTHEWTTLLWWYFTEHPNYGK